MLQYDIKKRLKLYKLAKTFFNRHNTKWNIATFYIDKNNNIKYSLNNRYGYFEDITFKKEIEFLSNNIIFKDYNIVNINQYKNLNLLYKAFKKNIINYV